MCGRFFIASDDAPDELELLLAQAEAWEIKRDPLFHLKRGEIFPGDAAAVIALNRRRGKSAFVMRWGYHVGKRLMINARSESAMDRPMFRESMAQRRCLIPASAYYEWDHRPAKPAKMIFWPDGQQMLYLAGLYRLEADSGQPVFTVLTRPAAEDVACFHHRMPVILPSALTDAWLDHASDPGALLTHSLDHMRYQPV